MLEDVYSEEDLKVGDSDDVTNSWAITATVPSTNTKVFNPHYTVLLTIYFVYTMMWNISLLLYLLI